MRKATLRFLTIPLLCFGGTLQSEQPKGALQNSTLPPFKPYATVNQLMASLVDPAADVIWEASGTIITTNGTEERHPKNAKEWMKVRDNAILLAEVGNLLMISPRARDNGEWMKAATGLIESGEKPVIAAKAKDAGRMFALGGELYEKCLDCHEQYASWGSRQPGRKRVGL